MDLDFSSLSRDLEVAEHACRSAEGEVKIGERPIQTSVSCKELGRKAHFPGEERLVVQLAPLLDAPHDLTYLQNLGYGETPAQQQDQLTLTMRELLDKGWENPLIVNAVPQGRGTPAYNAPGADVSKITVEDYLGDVRDLTRLLLKEGMIQGQVVVEGHSMGNLGAMAATGVLLEHEENYEVHSVIDFMGVTDTPLSLLRPGFLWTVGRQVPTGFAQFITGQGGVCLNDRNYNRIMLSQRRHPEPNPNSKGNDCDSARIFIPMTFNTQALVRDTLETMAEHSVSLWVVEGGLDNLIPDDTAPRWVKTAKAAGVETHAWTLTSIAHSFPYDMTPEQESEFMCLMRAAVPQKGPITLGLGE